MHFQEGRLTSEERSINAPEYHWINSEGERISMCEMDLKYLGNCMGMVRNVMAGCDPEIERGKDLIDACEVKIKEFEIAIELLEETISRKSPNSSSQARQKMSLAVFDITEYDLHEQE